MRAHEFIFEARKTDASLVSDIKDAYDAGLYPSEIAELLDINISKVNNTLLAYHPNRNLLGPKRKISSDMIQQVKELWNQGLKSVEIADLLDITPTQVKVIFRDYFPDREGKRKQHDSEIVSKIKQLWDQEKNSTEISEIVGISIQQVQNILTKHYPNRDRRGPGIKGTTTDDVNKMAELYRKGETLGSIASKFNLSKGVVRRHLTNRNDYEELKKDNIINKEKIKKPTQALTNRMINKPYSKGIRAIRRTGGPSGSSF